MPPAREMPELALEQKFFENFYGVMRGFLRQHRELTRVRFAEMAKMWPEMKLWAENLDETDPESVQTRGETMVGVVESHMKLAHEIVDMPPGRERDATFLDRPMMRSWVLQNADTETAPLARELYARYLTVVERLDPKFASELKIAYAATQREAEQRAEYYAKLSRESPSSD